MTERVVLDAGFHADIPAEVYHADPAPDPSLSSSLAKVLVSASPAHAYAQHPRLGGTYESDASKRMDFGSCAHVLMLGRGSGIEIIAAADYRTKAAQQARDEARAAGRIPVLTDDYARAVAMRDAAREALAEADLLDGFMAATPELVALAEDRGMWLRAMADRFDERMLTIWDYKTTSASAAPSSVGRLIENMGYDLSAAHYEHVFGLIRPEWRGRLKFMWLVQETTAPYEATICTLDATGRDIGARKAAFARGLWRDCITSGAWPGYPRGVVTAAYPTWAEGRWLDREVAAYDAGIDPLRHEATPLPPRESPLYPPV